MSRLIPLSLLSLLVALLAGCGNKGPLFLPPAKPTPAATAKPAAPAPASSAHAPAAQP
jgi:predicted small lipoprotein YifL